MGKTTGFLEFTRELPAKNQLRKGLRIFDEFEERYTDEKLNQQARPLHELRHSILPSWMSFGKYHS